MKTVGIICECNPFHGGHGYLMEQARLSGADCVVAVMSGNFVQRGEAAVADMHTRAKAVLLGGADLVLELPFPYSCAPAEFFAAAGVEILSGMGVDELWFGSECGDLSLLLRLADVADSPAFAERYAKCGKDNSGTAEAYLDCLSACLGEAVTLSSNDLLGIAYLRAIKKQKSAMTPITVRRLGSAYRSAEIEDKLPSATALRSVWRERGVGAMLPHLPEAVRDVYAECQAPADLLYAERFVLGHFRLTPSHELEQAAVLSGGLGGRLKKAAMQAAGLEELLSLAATKKYPRARWMRGILFALTGITDEELCLPVSYSRLLGANETGCAYLSSVRRKKRFLVVSRKTELPESDAVRRQCEWAERADSLYALCRPDAAVASSWEKNAVILKKGEKVY